MRILDAHHILYDVHTYTVDHIFDAHEVANKIGIQSNRIYKTLVTQGKSKQYYVFILPVEKELDLKKAAKVTNEKSIEMIALKQLTSITGYVRGGCSPLGMKKVFKTFCDQSALMMNTIIVSGGKLGLQIELKANDLLEVLPIFFENITSE